MDINIDWETAQRQDEALVTEFLSSVAGVYSELEIIDAADTNELRLDLQEAKERQNIGNESLLTLLQRNRCSFVALLSARFGEAGLSTNLARMGIRNHIEVLKHSLAKHGLDYIQKSKLLLNRKIHIFQGDVCLRDNLYSTLILEVAKACTDSVRYLQKIDQLARSMNPSNIAPYCEDDLTLDQKLARSLGFDSLQSFGLPYQIELEISRLISSLLFTITDVADLFIQQCQMNAIDGPDDHASTLSEWLKAEGHRLLRLSFPNNLSLESWELRRQNYFANLSVINRSVSQYLGHLESFMTVGAMKNCFRHPLSKSHQNFIKVQLLEQGKDSGTASRAAESLASYCRLQKIDLSQILQEEFEHIDPALRHVDINRLLEENPHQEAELKATQEKLKITKQVSKLSTFLAEVMKLASAGLCLLLALSQSCGIKKPPISDEPTMRPEIPYRASPNPTPAKLFEPLRKQTKKSIEPEK